MPYFDPPAGYSIEISSFSNQVFKLSESGPEPVTPFKVTNRKKRYAAEKDCILMELIYDKESIITDINIIVGRKVSKETLLLLIDFAIRHNANINLKGVESNSKYLMVDKILSKYEYFKDMTDI